MEWIDPNAQTAGRRLLIFDLDGTLADTLPGIRDGVNLTMEQYGFPTRSYEEIRVRVGKGARDLIRRSMPDGAAEDAELYERVFADYDRTYATTYANCTVYEGMTETLKVLKARGYLLAVLSNKQDAYVKTMVKELFGTELFSLVAGQTDLPKKPDPTVPLMIAEQLGFTAEQCAFVGDSEVDAQTGTNAGMLAVACSWGYRERSLLIENGARVVVDHPTELARLF